MTASSLSAHTPQHDHALLRGIAGRLPPCSPGRTGSMSTYHTSPRSGTERLNRAFFPHPALLDVVPPVLGIGHAQTFHLLGGQLDQCRVEGVARELVKQRANGDPAGAGCFGKAVAHL